MCMWGACGCISRITSTHELLEPNHPLHMFLTLNCKSKKGQKEKKKENHTKIYSFSYKCVTKTKDFFFLFFYFTEERQENWQGNSSVMERISRPPRCLITGSIFGILQQAS